jgi:phosphatidylserine/phosphatidylglycerophosphate/cardiolipin synthase-like enzyme
VSADPYVALGRFFTAHEADRVAAALDDGDSTGQALKEVHAARRVEAQQLVAAANLGAHRRDVSVAVLRAVAGARAVRTSITPVWTMPGAEASSGRLTRETQRLIDDARMSVVCSSYNFSPRSQMWTALRDASARPGVTVTVYVDATNGSPDAVARQIPRATVYRTAARPGSLLVHHAKFIIIDQTLTLLTSANFSYNAENSNIELGLLVHDNSLAESIESQLRGKHGVLYERV